MAGQVHEGCRSVLAAVTLRVVKPRVAWICAIVNGAAAFALATVLAPGVSLAPTPAGAAYVAGHLVEWRTGWALWMAAALSLLAFFRWWGSRLGWPAMARLAVAVASIPGISLGQAFLGEIFAISVLIGLTALAALSDLGAARRVLAASSSPRPWRSAIRRGRRRDDGRGCACSSRTSPSPAASSSPTASPASPGRSRSWASGD